MYTNLHILLITMKSCYLYGMRTGLAYPRQPGADEVRVWGYLPGWHSI